MPIVAAILVAFAIVIGGIVLAIVAVLAVRHWMRASADIAECRRRTFSKRSDG